MNTSLHYLKTYRERTGISLQDMAQMIGIDIGSLSKIEKRKRKPDINVLLSYHFILGISIDTLYKNQYKEIVKTNLSNATVLKDKLLEAMTSPKISKRITTIDTVIDQLVELKNTYDE